MVTGRKEHNEKTYPAADYLVSIRRSAINRRRSRRRSPAGWNPSAARPGRPLTRYGIIWIEGASTVAAQRRKMTY